MKAVTIEYKKVYGNYLIYPVCPNAILFSKLIGTKTFSLSNLANIKALGFEIITIDGNTFNFSL